MKTQKLFVALSAAALVLGAIGCTPKLRIRSFEPAPANLGAANQLVVVHSEGRRSAKEFVIQELTAQARAANFQVTDKTEEGITLRAAGRTAQITSPSSQQQPTETWLRVDVLEWSADRETTTERSKDSKGNTIERKVEKTVGKVLLAVTAATPKGTAILAEKEYEGRHEDSTNDTEEGVLREAASEAIAAFLADITPRAVYRDVELDESEEAQKPIIEVARAGNLIKAIEDGRAYIEKNPSSASAYYNLAVFLDASGQYEEALQAYDKAIAGSTKELYAKARADCAKRLADAMALAE